ncbi:MAG: hypothetical protein IPL81_10960 [Flavobacteriales bacterium]|nr:hypothetical protein [Flavobacteriales bacterium]
MHSVLLIGTGRLAFHLGHALRGAGYTIVGLAGRDATKTAELAKDLGCSEFGLNDALLTPTCGYLPSVMMPSTLSQKRFLRTARRPFT